MQRYLKYNVTKSNGTIDLAPYQNFRYNLYGVIRFACLIKGPMSLLEVTCGQKNHSFSLSSDNLWRHRWHKLLAVI